MSDFTKPWSNDFPTLSAQHWREAVERGRPGHIAGLRSQIEPDLACEPLSPGAGVALLDRTFRAASDWLTAQQYDLRDPEALARQIAVDATFDLQSAWVPLDLALRAGAKPRGVVRPGLRLASDEDAATVLEAVMSADVALWIEAGAAGRSVARHIEDAARKLGVDLLALRGGIVCDPLATLAESGCLHADLASALGDLVDTTTWAEDKAHGLATIELSAVAYHDAGATAAQELAFVIATGLVYLRALERAGIEPNRALPRFVLRFAVGSEVLLEVAKLRAARWLWERVAGKCGAQGVPARICARTAWRNRTQLDPRTNLIRGTVETFAAIVGGADEIVTQPFSEVLGAGDAAARRWALGTQHLLRHESHLGWVRDPAGGSGCVEDLTRKLVTTAWEIVRRIEASGGMAEAMLLGEIDAWIAEAAEWRRQSLATGTAALVGTTLHPAAREESIEVERVDGHEMMTSAARLEAPPLSRERLAEPYEALRHAAAHHRERKGRPLRVALVSLTDATGTPSQEMLGRAKSILALGGLEAHETNVDALVQTVAALDTKVVVVCGADEVVLSRIEAIVTAARRGAVTHVVATAATHDAVKALRDAGVAGLITPTLDIPDLLVELHRAEGVRS